MYADQISWYCTFKVTNKWDYKLTAIYFGKPSSQNVLLLRFITCLSHRSPICPAVLGRRRTVLGVHSIPGSPAASCIPRSPCQFAVLVAEEEAVLH